MKTVYFSADGKPFATKAACLKHERRMTPTIKIPRMYIDEAVRQCTPYMVSAKERRELAAALQPYLK